MEAYMPGNISRRTALGLGAGVLAGAVVAGGLRGQLAAGGGPQALPSPPPAGSPFAARARGGGGASGGAPAPRGRPPRPPPISSSARGRAGGAVEPTDVRFPGARAGREPAHVGRSG